MNCKILTATIALAAVGLLSHQPASAETLSVAGWANGNRDVYITSPVTTQLRAVPFQVTDSADSFQAWCVDLFGEPSGTYGFDSGSFLANRGSAASSGALTTAFRWLNSLPTTSDHSVSFWVSPTHPNLVVIPPVPEPETFSLLLAGLGLMAVIARRRISARIEPS